jgi:hypothetical protein
MFPPKRTQIMSLGMVLVGTRPMYYSLGDDETTSQGGFGSQTSISSNLRTTPIAYCLPLTCLLECVAEAIRFLLYRAIYLVHGNRYARQTRDE